MYTEEKYRHLDQDFDNPQPVSMLKNLSNTLRNTNKTSQSISSWIPRKQSKLKSKLKTEMANPSSSVYNTIKTQPTSLGRTKVLWPKRELTTTATLPEFKSLRKNGDIKNSSFMIISKKPKMTRELSDLCSMDVQSKQFKLKLLINNISTLKVKQPKMAIVLATHLDRRSIKKRLNMFRQNQTLDAEI